MTKNITRAAIIAGLYIALSLLLAPLSYGPIQIRLSEALMILSAISLPGAIGVVIGCFITNLFSPYGMIDIVFGTLATAIAAFGSYRLRKIKWLKLPILSMLCPVIANAVVLGVVLTYAQFGNFNTAMIAIIGGQIALSELIACVGIGLLLHRPANKLLR